MQVDAQVVTALCGRLVQITDRFDGLGDEASAHSYILYQMLEESMCGAQYNYPYRNECKYYTLAEALTESGFYVLGAGHFSLVLGHDDAPRSAFKLSMNRKDSYVPYAMYCRLNAGAKHLPQIQCMLLGEQVQVIAVKQYVPYEVGAEVQGIHNYPDLVYSFLQYWMEPDTVRADYFHGGHSPLGESFDSALCDIGKYFDGAASFDLHSSNVMYDEDSQEFIITDPVSFTKGEL